MTEKELDKKEDQKEPGTSSDESKQELEKPKEALSASEENSSQSEKNLKKSEKVQPETKKEQASDSKDKKQGSKQSKDVAYVAENYSRNIDQSDFAEIKEVLVSVNRTAKVVKGGRRFSFAAVVVVGDGQGRVGYGLGKANEILDARSKASQAAKKNMIKVKLKDNRTIFHDIVGKFCSGHVLLRSARVGTGVIAGGPMRSVFEMLGVHDIVAKSLGSSNVHNIIGATFDALNNLCTPDYIRNKRVIE